jgi:uncharacterized protein (TIGR03086 family)
MSETLERYSSLASDFGARVHGTKDWSASSPCEGWSARDVAAHVINGHRRMIASASGAEPTELGGDEDPVAAWDAATTGLKAVLGDPERAGGTTQTPFGPMPIEQMVGRFICTDVLVHTWDLARATGQDEKLQTEAVEAAYSGLKPLDAMLRSPGIMGPKIEPSPGADSQTQLLNFLGRAV